MDVTSGAAEKAADDDGNPAGIEGKARLESCLGLFLLLLALLLLLLVPKSTMRNPSSWARGKEKETGPPADSMVSTTPMGVACTAADDAADDDNNVGNPAGVGGKGKGLWRRVLLLLVVVVRRETPARRRVHGVEVSQVRLRRRLGGRRLAGI